MGRLNQETSIPLAAGTFGSPGIVITAPVRATTNPAPALKRGCEFALSEVWAKGGEGGIALAEKVLETLEGKESNFHILTLLSSFYQDLL